MRLLQRLCLDLLMRRLASREHFMPAFITPPSDRCANVIVQVLGQDVLLKEHAYVDRRIADPALVLDHLVVEYD